MHKLNLKFSMPSTRTGRTIVGSLLIVGGILGFLPILGFWMIPLGLFMLSQDFATIRRFRRRCAVWLSRRWNRFKESRQLADK